MKKQKTFSLALAALLLAACSQAPQQETSSPTAAPAQEAASAQSAAPSQAETVQDKTALFAPTATMEETVLVDESGIKITATNLAYTAYSVKLGLTIENNTEQDLSFYSGTAVYSCNSVNGYMMSGGYLNTDVTAGKKTNETVTFDTAELELMGIRDIADIEIGFQVEDSDYDDYLLTGPRQIKTSLADSYDYTADTYRAAVADGSALKQMGVTVLYDTEEELYSQKEVRILSQTLVGNADGDRVLLVEVENGSAEGMGVFIGNGQLNGLSLTGTWASDWVSPGKRRVLDLHLSSALGETYRAAFGIQEIGAVRYSVTLKDEDYDDLTLPQEVALELPGVGSSFDATGEEVYQENGIRIVSKGLAPDELDFIGDLHLLLLVENGSGTDLVLDVEDGSLSANGYMTDFLCYSTPVPAGASGVLDVELLERDLEENGISGMDDISEIELTFEIRDEHYKTIAEPSATVTVS